MALRIALRIGNRDFLLNPEQAETILSVVSESEMLVEHYEKGDDDKYHTLYTIDPPGETRHYINPRLVTEAEYNSLRFFTEARAQAKQST